MTDKELAFSYMQLAAGCKPIEPKPIPLPFPSLIDELVQYTESPAYRDLIRKEEEKIKNYQNVS